MLFLSTLLLAGMLLVSDSTLIVKTPQAQRTQAAKANSGIQVAPIVTVAQGLLEGSIKTLKNGESYYSFKGIPYAQPPLGDLRFRAPLPPTAWTGIRSAKEHGSNCTQYDPNIDHVVAGSSEDCLFLNVYSKSLNPNAKTPVMFFIHGGAFLSGSGDTNIYGPEFILQHDVVLVTINYRLEVLGFLSLDTPEVPGNAALKDQVLAMRWVKENIVKFGGDPDNVTIFGESAGAASVSYHLLSPMSEGLFVRAIIQSGCALEDWAISRGMKERAFRIAKVLGYETTDTEELTQFLKNVPVTDLPGMTFKTRTTDEELRGLPMYFVPHVEKKFDNVEAFITEEPIDILLSQRMNKVPLVIGYNNAEGYLVLTDQLAKSPQFNENSTHLVPRELVSRIIKDQLEDFGRRIMTIYTGDKGMGNDNVQEVVNVGTDLYFAYNLHRFTYLYNKLNVPVYMYRFDYDTKLNEMKRELGFIDLPRAAHEDDLYYLFNNDLTEDIYSSDEKLQKIVFDLTKLWTNFAITSNPTPEGSSVKWPLYTQSGRDYLILNEEISSAERSDADRVELLDKLYCEAGVPCITGST